MVHATPNTTPNTTPNPTAPQPPPCRSRLTHEDAMMFWRARDAYRVQNGLYGIITAFFLLEFLAYTVQGRWEMGVLHVAWQALALWGVCRGGRWLLRQAWAWARSRWHGLVLIALLGMTLSGCEPMERGVAKMYGLKVDPLPGPCAPESFQARQCLAIQHEGKKP